MLLYSCDYYDRRPIVYNHQSSNICIELYNSDELDSNHLNHSDYYISNYIAPHDSSRFINMDGIKAWSEYIQSSQSKRLNVFVFQLDSIKEYGIEHVVFNGLYDHLIFSEQELDNLNWKIVID